MFTEDELLPISALQHVVYCDRQAALIHLERLWTENVHTVQGRHLHDKTDEGGREARGDLLIVRALPLRSLAHGLSGIADVVEFHCDPLGAAIPRRAGRWRPFPVEYKKGKPKRHRADEVQLCAQALCLEEMFETEVVEGALYYGTVRRRKAVALDPELRRVTLAAASAFRRIIDAAVTPPPRWGPKCRQCSLIGDCRPRAVEKSPRRYLAALLRHDGEVP